LPDTNSSTSILTCCWWPVIEFLAWPMLFSGQLQRCSQTLTVNLHNTQPGIKQPQPFRRPHHYTSYRNERQVLWAATDSRIATSLLCCIRGHHIQPSASATSSPKTTAACTPPPQSSPATSSVPQSSPATSSVHSSSGAMSKKKKLLWRHTLATNHKPVE
jgi:hypothetical protein